MRLTYRATICCSWQENGRACTEIAQYQALMQCCTPEQFKEMAVGEFLKMRWRVSANPDEELCPYHNNTPGEKSSTPAASEGKKTQ